MWDFSHNVGNSGIPDITVFTKHSTFEARAQPTVPPRSSVITEKMR